jgi:hypothetical protein
MRMFAHIFNTWALAQLLHPLLFLFYLVVMGSTAVEFWIGWIFFIFFFSVFASIPSLLMAWILFYMISNAELTMGEQLIAWFVSAVAAILLNFILVSLAVDRIIDGKTFYILPPAMAAVVSSILIRLRSFFQFQLTYKLDS